MAESVFNLELNQNMFRLRATETLGVDTYSSES